MARMAYRPRLRSGAAEGDPNQATGMQDVALVQSVDNAKNLQLAEESTSVHQDLNPQMLPMPEPERVLVPATRLKIVGFNEALRLRVNGRVPLADVSAFVVSPGPALLEVDRLDLAGRVVETRAGRVTIVAGRTSVVRYADLAPTGSWSGSKKLLVAGIATLTAAGAVYLVATQR